ncbi:MAG TPA: hypothetical protein VG722_01490 [Tepidisphaeraceae bacterium]|nr:hypothetical protein [Tepidisphaeraceae bacterium]
MIPPFNHHGYLPPGIHVATLEEVIASFGQGSEQREAQGQSLLWLIPLCRAAHICKLLIDGSFISDRLEPNDVDCALLQGSGYSAISPAAAELRAGLPFLEIRIVKQDEYNFLSEVFFASDRDMIPKGMLEVVI